MICAPDDLAPGRTVRFIRNGVTGTLVALRGGRAEIETATGRILVNRDEITGASDHNSTRARRGQVEVSMHYDEDVLDNELDLHHCVVADVEPALLQFISQALVRGFDRIRIIHGKGSGKLRTEVQRCLKGCSTVSRFEYAQTREGSYGATVAWLGTRR